MEKLKLYRGISVSKSEVNKVIDEIRNNGLSNKKAETFAFNNLRDNLNELLNSKSLSRDQTEIKKNIAAEKYGLNRFIRGEESLCFADKLGATFYAQRSLRDDETALLLSTEVDINDVAVLSRDFLITIFSNLNPNDPVKTLEIGNKLTKIFGDKILLYFKKIIDNPEIDKFAYHDLLSIDNEIIKSHYNNELIIEGKSKTFFKSTFLVKIPIKNVQIEDLGNKLSFIPDVKFIDYL